VEKKQHSFLTVLSIIYQEFFEGIQPYVYSGQQSNPTPEQRTIHSMPLTAFVTLVFTGIHAFT